MLFKTELGLDNSGVNNATFHTAHIIITDYDEQSRHNINPNINKY
jgi:P2-related tail formation protein